MGCCEVSNSMEDDYHIIKSHRLKRRISEN